MEKQLPCVWCGKPEADHGKPGESKYAAAMWEETGNNHWHSARLCPTPGVTSQFFTTQNQLVGKRWTNAIHLDTVDCDGKPWEEPTTIMVEVEQAKKNKPAAELTIVTNSVNVSVINLSPKELERLAEFLNEAADMIRHCS